MMDNGPSFHDYDLSTGLMPKIQALIAPPNSSSTLTKKKDHKKDKGTSFNHQICDYCQEGGDLICCDRCPAAFHLICNQPPLSEDEVPEGEWLCYRCRILEELSLSSTENAKASSILSSSMNHKGSINNNKRTSQRSSVSRPKDSKVEQQNNASEENNNNIDKEKDPKNAFKVIIETARKMQPQEFKLPYEFMSHVPLPGYPKSGLSISPSQVANSSKRGSSKGGGSVSSFSFRREIDRDDSGLVSLPLKTCYFCGQSCRKQVLISCDFCPSFFHPDCLDPPMTSIPSGAIKWMCPLHVEKLLEEKICPEDSLLTKRLRIHSSMSEQKLDHLGIQLDFLTNAKLSRDVTFINKSVAKSKINEYKMNVPHTIKIQYRPENQPSLYPPLQQLVYAASVVQNMPSTTSQARSVEDDVRCLMVDMLDKIAPIIHEPPKPEDQETWLKSVIELQSNIAKRMSEAGTKEETKQPSTVDLLDQLNPEMIKALALQRLNQLLSEQPNVLIEDVMKNELSVRSETEKFSVFPTMSPSSSTIPSTLKSTTSNDNISSRTRHRDIHSVTAKLRTPVNEVRPRAILCPVVKLNNERANNNNNSVKTSVMNVCPMSYRSLSIGIGPDNDLNLTEYGRCSFVSTKHACIYYDEVSKRYELINYSEHGSIVDNVLYACDFSIKRRIRKESTATLSSTTTKRKVSETSSSAQTPNNKKTRSATVTTEHIEERVRNGFQAEPSVENRNGDKRQNTITESATEKRINGISHKGSSLAGGNAPDEINLQHPIMKSKRKSIDGCTCKVSPSASIGRQVGGWEGPATINHGSHLRFGCIQFLFYITSHGNESLSINSTNDGRISNGSDCSTLSTISTSSTPTKD